MHEPTCVFWANLTPFSFQDDFLDGGIDKHRDHGTTAPQTDQADPVEAPASAATPDVGERQQSRFGLRMKTIGSKFGNIRKAVTQFNSTSENPATLDTPQNIHQATIYYCMNAEGTGCSKCLWFSASISIILMQVAAVLAVFFGVFAPSCSENGDCPIDGQFCPNGEFFERSVSHTEFGHEWTDVHFVVREGFEERELSSRCQFCSKAEKLAQNRQNEEFGTEIQDVVSVAYMRNNSGDHICDDDGIYYDWPSRKVYHGKLFAKLLAAP